MRTIFKYTFIVLILGSFLSVGHSSNSSVQRKQCFPENNMNRVLRENVYHKKQVFTNVVNLSVELPSRCDINISLFDLQGRKVHQSIRGLSPGEHTLAFNPDQLKQELNNGVYFIRIEYGLQSHTQKLLLLN